MKKNYRKVPTQAVEKVKNFDSDTIEVCTILKVKTNDLENPKYKNLGLGLGNDGIKFNADFIPSEKNGRYSSKNVNGYKIKYPDKPKVSKSFYCGQRPYYGDWSKGSFSLYVNRYVIPYDIIPPKELAIKVTEVQRNEAHDNSIIVLKVAVDAVLDRTHSKFDDDFLFAVNLLQETVFSFDVFSTNSTIEDYLKTQFVAWEIFPPGTRQNDLAKIIDNNKTSDKEYVERVEDRYAFLKSQNPTDIIKGNSGMRHYFGAKFSDNLVVFENTDYGNAVYVLFEEWEALSKLSRTEIQNRPENEYVRIPHGKNWKQSLSLLIKERLGNRN